MAQDAFPAHKKIIRVESITLYGDGGDSEDDAEMAELARSEAAAAYRRRRAAAAAHAPCAHARRGHNTWGGAQQRNVALETRFARADEGARAAPVAFARYASPVIDLNDYEMRRAGAWRVALPRALPPLHKQETLKTIYIHGPARAGYVAIGETLVPGSLGPGARKALSDMAGGSLLDE